MGPQEPDHEHDAPLDETGADLSAYLASDSVFHFTPLFYAVVDKTKQVGDGAGR
jgi:hypothetical protein